MSEKHYILATRDCEECQGSGRWGSRICRICGGYGWLSEYAPLSEALDPVVEQLKSHVEHRLKEGAGDKTAQGAVGEKAKKKGKSSG